MSGAHFGARLTAETGKTGPPVIHDQRPTSLVGSPRRLPEDNHGPSLPLHQKHLPEIRILL